MYMRVMFQYITRVYPNSNAFINSNNIMLYFMHRYFVHCICMLHQCHIGLCGQTYFLNYRDHCNTFYQIILIFIIIMLNVFGANMSLFSSEYTNTIHVNCTQNMQNTPVLMHVVYNHVVYISGDIIVQEVIVIIQLRQ